jgi:hypothetical protein
MLNIFSLAYNPLEKVKNDPTILFNPQGKTRSKRQQFRQMRRHQLNGGEVAIVFKNNFLLTSLKNNNNANRVERTSV